MKKTLKRDLTEIAKKHLHIDTLSQRFSDDLDFHDVSAWGVANALTAAYEIGHEAAKKEAAKNETKKLWQKLNKTCDETKTSGSGIKYLVEYYINSLGWGEDEALNYAIDLFENGTISQIKIIGKEGQEI